LNLNGHIDAHVKSAYHHRKEHDDLHHWTFTFTAPSCHGMCTGHAYIAGAARRARIWDGNRARVFNA
jgi:hypothetical protein